jgi:hypothetical protein
VRAPEFGDLALDAKANALAALLDGGTLEIGIGDRVLARLRFGTPAFYLASRGAAAACPMAPEVDAPAGGRPTGFRAYAYDGEFVFGGTVGPPGDGSEYDLVIDGIVHEGGEVSVEQLVYRESL